MKLIIINRIELLDIINLMAITKNFVNYIILNFVIYK